MCALGFAVALAMRSPNTHTDTRNDTKQVNRLFARDRLVRCRAYLLDGGGGDGGGGTVLSPGSGYDCAVVHTECVHMILQPLKIK